MFEVGTAVFHMREFEGVRQGEGEVRDTEGGGGGGSWGGGGGGGGGGGEGFFSLCRPLPPPPPRANFSQPWFRAAPACWG